MKIYSSFITSNILFKKNAYINITTWTGVKGGKSNIITTWTGVKGGKSNIILEDQQILSISATGQTVQTECSTIINSLGSNK